MTDATKARLCMALVAALAGLWLGVGWIYGFEVFHPERIAALGWPAALGYAVLIAVLGGLGVPPVVMMMPAIAVWPLPIAFVQSLTGGMGAALIGFLLSRYSIREAVAPRIPPHIRKYERRLETHGLSTTIILRLLFYLFPPINWMLGISLIPLPIFLLGTLIGMLPGTLVYLFTGKGLIGVLGSLSIWQMVGFVGLGAAGLVIWWRWAVTTGGPDDDV